MRRDRGIPATDRRLAWPPASSKADEILSEWGEDGQDAARESLWIDFGFLLAYGAFLTLALATVRDLARERNWRRLAAIGGVAVSFGALGAAFDALENVCLLGTLAGAGAAFPLLAAIFAACKFILLTTAIVYLLVGVAMLLRSRGPAARRRGGPSKSPTGADASSR